MKLRSLFVAVLLLVSAVVSRACDKAELYACIFTDGTHEYLSIYADACGAAYDLYYSTSPTGTLIPITSTPITDPYTGLADYPIAYSGIGPLWVTITLHGYPTALIASYEAQMCDQGCYAHFTYSVSSYLYNVVHLQADYVSSNYNYTWTIAGHTATGSAATINVGALTGPADICLTVVNVNDGSTCKICRPICLPQPTTRGTFPPIGPVSWTYASNTLTALTAQFSIDVSGEGGSTYDPAATYSWDFGDGSEPVEGLTVTHEYPAGGSYTPALTVTSLAGTYTEEALPWCFYDLNVRTYTPVSLGKTTPAAVVNINNDKLSDVRLYPNPATDVANVTFELGSDANINVQVIDVTGRVINTISNKMEAGSQKIQIATDRLTPGIYSVKIQTESSTIVKQLNVLK